jgi:hypothetical protein
VDRRHDEAWSQLALSVRMLLGLSISGVPFCGADIGGSPAGARNLRALDADRRALHSRARIRCG